MAKNINNLDKSLKQNITPADIGAAAASHGTHLTIGTGASNAAAGNHTHSTYATTTQLTTTNNNIGTLSSLQTSAKGNLVAAINEVFQSGVNAKQQLVDALNANGASVSTSDSWNSLIGNIGGGSLDIISATTLPATGKENQLCAITSTTPNRFVIADNSADTEVSDNIVRIRTTENAACTAYTYPMGNIFLNLRIAAVYQNRSAIPLWLYRNNEWIQICFTSDFALKNKVVQPQFPLATDLSSSGCHFHSSYGMTLADSKNSNMLLGTPFQSAINFSKYKAIRIKGSWTGGSTYPSAYAPVAIGVFGIASRFSSGIAYIAGYRPSEIPNIYSNVKFNKYTVISTSSGGPTSGTFDYTFDINTTATCHLGLMSSMIMTTRITDIEFILK